MIDGTGAVNELSSWLYIVPDHRQNVLLELCQIFFCHLILDIRLLANDAKTGARKIRNDDIRLFFPGRIFFQRIPHLCPDIGKSGPADVILHQQDLIFC